MPGPVSDSFDPEFGTGENAGLVEDAVRRLADRLSACLGERAPIVEVVKGPPGAYHEFAITEREARVVRFALERALESL